MNNETRKNVEGAIFLVLFCLTVPVANWMLGHFGTVCPPNSPCLVPVAPGLMAPSGVLLIGAALVLRDLVQRRLGVECLMPIHAKPRARCAMQLEAGGPRWRRRQRLAAMVLRLEPLDPVRAGLRWWWSLHAWSESQAQCSEA